MQSGTQYEPIFAFDASYAAVAVAVVGGAVVAVVVVVVVAAAAAAAAAAERPFSFEVFQANALELV